MRGVTLYDKNKYEEVEDSKVLDKFVSQALRDDRSYRRKLGSSREKPLDLKTAALNLSSWSNVAKRTFDILTSDDLDRTKRAKEVFEKFMLDICCGRVPFDGENNDIHEKQIDAKLGTDTTDQELRSPEELATIDDMKIANKSDQKKKLNIVHERSWIHLQDSMWVENTLSGNNIHDTEAAECLLTLVNNMGALAKAGADDDNTAIM